MLDPGESRMCVTEPWSSCVPSVGYTGFRHGSGRLGALPVERDLVRQYDQFSCEAAVCTKVPSA